MNTRSVFLPLVKKVTIVCVLCVLFAQCRSEVDVDRGLGYIEDLYGPYRVTFTEPAAAARFVAVTPDKCDGAAAGYRKLYRFAEYDAVSSVYLVTRDGTPWGLLSYSRRENTGVTEISRMLTVGKDGCDRFDGALVDVPANIQNTEKGYGYLLSGAIEDLYGAYTIAAWQNPAGPSVEVTAEKVGALSQNVAYSGLYYAADETRISAAYLASGGNPPSPYGILTFVYDAENASHIVTRKLYVGKAACDTLAAAASGPFAGKLTVPAGMQTTTNGESVERYE